MTLPKGFGSSNGKCSDCGDYLDEHRCTNQDCRRFRGRRDGELPFTKKQVKLGIWYSIFIGFALFSIFLSIHAGYMGVVVMGVYLFFSTIIGVVAFEPKADRYFREVEDIPDHWYSRSQIFPWFGILLYFSGKYHFRQ